jgi:hypothetical protein
VTSRRMLFQLTCNRDVMGWVTDFPDEVMERTLITEVDTAAVIEIIGAIEGTNQVTGHDIGRLFRRGQSMLLGGKKRSLVLFKKTSPFNESDISLICRLECGML